MYITKFVLLIKTNIAMKLSDNPIVEFDEKEHQNFNAVWYEFDDVKLPYNDGGWETLEVMGVD